MIDCYCLGKKKVRVLKTVGGWGGITLNCPHLVLQTECLLAAGMSCALLECICWFSFIQKKFQFVCSIRDCSVV